MNAQTYQWNAAEYARSSRVQQQWARELIGKLRLNGDERVLDIGCGDGKVTAEIAGCVVAGSVLGIDNSEAMIVLAQSQYTPESFLNLRFQLGDATRLPFNNKFDVVFSNATLHWILDHRPVLHGIKRSLVRGGRMLLQMGGHGNAAEVIAAFEQLMVVNEWYTFFYGFRFPYGFFTVEEYRPWLREAGLQEIRMELIPKIAVHEDRTAFEGWIRTTWLPYTQRVPVEKREEFITLLADMYLQQHPADGEGKVHVRMSRLEVEALKQ